MMSENINALAKLCGADAYKLNLDIKKYGVNGFFVHLELLDYPLDVEKKFTEILKLLLNASPKKKS